MDKRDLKDRYEATGDEAAYEEALPLYEQAIANGADPQDFIDFGYLLECHARNLLRRAVASYEHALDLDPVESRSRMRRLRRVVRRRDVHAWSRDFLAALSEAVPASA